MMKEKFGEEAKKLFSNSELNEGHRYPAVVPHSEDMSNVYWEVS